MKRHTVEEIIPKLRQAEVDLAQDLTRAQVRQRLAIGEQTLHRRRNQYGGLKQVRPTQTLHPTRSGRLRSSVPQERELIFSSTFAAWRILLCEQPLDRGGWFSQHYRRRARRAGTPALGNIGSELPMASFFRCLPADLPPGPPLIGNNLVFYSAVGGALLLLLILWLRRKRPAPLDAEAGLMERLSDYPPAGPGPQRLLLRGQPLRLRLVVMAPLGKQPLPANGAMEPLLDLVLRGLGDIARQDRPRIRVWPAQLSHHGFAPKFFRLTQRPESVGKPSPWILTAGPVRDGGRQFLLGLALYGDSSTGPDNFIVQGHEWSELFRVGPRT